MSLNDPTNKDNKLVLTILLRMGNKYRKIAKSTIHLYKKYFVGSNPSLAKWVHLELLSNSLEQMGHETTIILQAMNNMGKIYMNLDMYKQEEDETRARLKEAQNHLGQAGHDQLLKNIYNDKLKKDLQLLPVTKDKAYHNKNEKFRSIVDTNNDFLRSLKAGKHTMSDDELFEDIPDDGNVLI